MGMIKKTVTGVADDLKLVKNGKQYPKAASGGTERGSFKGSNDTRAAGDVRANKLLKDAPGYIDQGPVTMGDTDYGKQFTNKGDRKGIKGNVTVASEDVTQGMGGKFWKEPTGF